MLSELSKIVDMTCEGHSLREKAFRLANDVYILKDGAYFKIDKTGKILSYIIVNKNTIENEDYKWFKQRDFYSKLVTMNKPVDKTKKIHSNNMMIEGDIWAKFYDCFKYILPTDFIMNKRVRRPPDNPINALISFGNSILYAKTVTQLYHTHLNQEISYLHSPSEGRFSLSLDISEVFKPAIVFKTIFYCVNNRKLNVEKHFEKAYNYCVLNEEGRKIFISELENRFNLPFQHSKLKRKITYKQAIKIDGYKLIKWIMEDKEFIPFDMESKF